MRLEDRDVCGREEGSSCPVNSWRKILPKFTEQRTKKEHCLSHTRGPAQSGGLAEGGVDKSKTCSNLVLELILLPERSKIVLQECH